MLEEVDKVEKSLEAIGEMDFLSSRIEDADHSLLIVTEESLSVHVQLQPALIAYYGIKRKEAERDLSSCKSDFERWEKEKFPKSKKDLEELAGPKGKKPTIADIEAHIIVFNKSEHNGWMRRLEEAQRASDTFDVFYEAIRQKSFTLREFCSMHSVELANANEIDSVRQIQRKERGKVSTQ